MKKTKILAMCMVVVFSAAAVWADALQSGADRLAATQNSDGGWGWPLTGASAPNTVGPIGMGLAQAYRFTGDAGHLTALGKVGTFLLAKTNNFSPSDGYLAAQLDRIFGGITYTEHVKTNFYDKLAAGIYDRNGAGTLYDTAGYVNLIRTSRAAGGQANMAAWDIGIGLVGAASVGADTAAWIAGTKAEINELDGNAYYDVIGLAGAVYGLAFVGAVFDPTAGQHAAASSVKDLADILAGYQISTGGFTWNSGYISAGNEANQETAYAILALNKVNRASYIGVIQNAASYLEIVQLSSGGWDNYPGDPAGENNELTGEALWAIAAARGDNTSATLVPNTLNAARNSTVNVSINMSIDPGITMSAISTNIFYDPNVFTFDDMSVVVQGDLLTHTWDLSGGTSPLGDLSDLRVGGIDLDFGEALAAGSGTLLTFKLKVNADAPTGSSLLTWGVYDGYDNAIAGFDYGDADFNDIILPESALHGVSIKVVESAPTAITLASFEAKPGNRNVTLIWETATEIDNAGFNILRAESENGAYIKINDAIIPAKAGAAAGASYQFIDSNAKNRTTYYYKLQDIDLNGNTTDHGPKSATPRLIFGFGK